MILAIICRRSKFLNEKINRVNFVLKFICEENRYFFIDNRNIETRDLWKNGMCILLLKSREVNSEMYTFNNKQFLLITPSQYFLEAHTHTITESAYP